MEIPMDNTMGIRDSTQEDSKRRKRLSESRSHFQPNVFFSFFQSIDLSTISRSDIFGATVTAKDNLEMKTVRDRSIKTSHIQFEKVPKRLDILPTDVN